MMKLWTSSLVMFCLLLLLVVDPCHVVLVECRHLHADDGFPTDTHFEEQENDHVDGTDASGSRPAITAMVEPPEQPQDHRAMAIAAKSSGSGSGSDVACGDGNRGNGTCVDGTCCSQYGYCGTTVAYCGVIGLYKWTWSSSSTVVADENVGIAFSGYADVRKALSASSAVLSSLQGLKYISIGGGDSSGRWTSQVLVNLNNFIKKGKLKAYKGICYDVEEGDSGLSSAFATSFATAKKNGFKVLVTISHSAPYGISDAKTLMNAFFSSTKIDYLSPQLYASGTEAQNDYSLTSGSGITWSAYKKSHAAIVPSIVQASYYSDAQTYFASQGITLAGYIQWTN